MDVDLIAMVTQFGVSGLIGWMWLTERRATASRDRELSEAHRALVGKETELDALVQLVRDNTRAVAALEGSLREALVQLGAGPRVGRSVHSGGDAA